MRILYFLFSFLIPFQLVTAQGKVNIEEGPVFAYSKYDQTPRQEYNDGKLYLTENIFLQKDDWLNVQAISREVRLFVLLYDLKERKYLRLSDDSLFISPFWKTALSWTSSRTDSFAIMIAAQVDRGSDDMFSDEKIDTPKISFTISRYRSAADKPDWGMSFSERLAYLGNHWTAGYRCMPRQSNPKSELKGKPAYEFFPDAPLTLIDSMGASIMKLGYNHHNSYFQYTLDMPYAKAKAIYGKLQGLLKQATDKTVIEDFNSPNHLSRVNELALTNFYIKVQRKFVPVEFNLFTPAPAGFAYIPVSLFLLGDKTNAKVLLVMGEDGDDIYDIGM